MSTRLTRTTLTSFALIASTGLLPLRVLAQEAPPAEAPPGDEPLGDEPGPPAEPPASPVEAEAEPSAPQAPSNPSVEPEASSPEAVEVGDDADLAADEEDEAEITAPPDSDLGAVVVTANRREQKIQDVPIAIAVVSGQQVLDQNLTTSNDVERITPNLSAQASGGRGNKPRWFLRGIGTNDPSVNLEAPIGVYQDDVFIAFQGQQSFPIFDIERIEVLKGPQGSLWGKNTTAGAIHFISKRPSFDPASGYARAGIGNVGSRTAEAAYGGPVLGETLAARAAFTYEEQEGWATNLRDGSQGPQFQDFASRLQLLANITDDVDFLVNGTYRVLDGGGNPSYPIGVLPGGGIQQTPQNPNIYTPDYGDSPVIGSNFLQGTQTSQLKTSAISGTLNVHIDDFTITSITAYNRADTDSLSSSYWPEPSFRQSGSYSTVNSDQVTQELRVASPREDRFNWIAGLHYFNWALDSQSATGNFGPADPATSYINNYYAQQATSYAGFASAKFNVTEPFAINAGIRYTYDRKEARAQRLFGQGVAGDPLVYADRGNWYQPQAVATPLAQSNIERDAWWGQLTYDLTPEYRINENVLAYARFARGFRAGTFNPTIVRDPDGTLLLPQTNPEILWDWELGAKTTWFGGKLIANITGFYYLLEDVQLNVQTPNPTGNPAANTSVVQNAAGGRIIGGELELDARPIEELRLTGGLGLLKAEYTDFFAYQGATEIDASGNQFYRVPESSFTVSIEYKIPLTETQAISIGTDWNYRDRIFHNAVVQDDPVQETPPYVLGNAEIRYLLDGGRLVLQGYVRNLADTSYKILSQVVSGGAYPTSLGQPRTFGVQAIARF